MTIIKTSKHLANFEGWLDKTSGTVDAPDRQQLISEGDKFLKALRDDVSQECDAVTDIAISSSNIGRGISPQWEPPGREECLRVREEVKLRVSELAQSS